MSHFHVCWAVDIRGCVFSAVLSNSCQKTTMADFRYKSIKSWKIDNMDLTQQFSLSIFTDFRYQSIKITWLLPIFIDWLLRAFSVYEVVRVASRVNKQTTRLASDANNFVNAKSHARGKPGSARRVLDTGGGTWVFFGLVCVARDSKLAPRSKTIPLKLIPRSRNGAVFYTPF